MKQFNYSRLRLCRSPIRSRWNYFVYCPLSRAKYTYRLMESWLTTLITSCDIFALAREPIASLIYNIHVELLRSRFALRPRFNLAVFSFLPASTDCRTSRDVCLYMLVSGSQKTSSQTSTFTTLLRIRFFLR